MHICLSCGAPCTAVPIMLNDDDDCSDLDIVSDCCFEEFQEVDEDYINDLINTHRCIDEETLADLSDFDRLVLSAMSYEV